MTERRCRLSMSHRVGAMTEERGASAGSAGGARKVARRRGATMDLRGDRASRTRPVGAAVSVVLVGLLALVVATACSGSAERRAVEGEIESHSEGTFYEPPKP